MKQGIVTILGSDFCHGNKPGGASIRRTLSADMSSKKWLQQNGFYSPAVKKIPSSSSSPPSSSSSSSSSSESEEEYEEITAPGQDDVWRAIQAKKERDDEEMKKKKPLQMDCWGTMLTHKSENSAALLAAAATAPLPPPYVHPLVKRSASTLSEKSLEICTESLGSETGSDCFSAETEDQEKLVVMLPVVVGDSNDQFADTHVAKYKKSPTRPFPPPLPSIAGGDGSALHVQSHRENGRLVLEAVSVPQRNHFHAQRCDGRLVLTLAHAPSACEVTLVEEVFDNMEDVDEDVVTFAEEEEEKVDDGGGNEGYVAVEPNLSLPSGIMSLYNLEW
ncbi:hypothetical protein MIMGU_mgv1a021532mg [Erythranthe guttata]|uniref:FAF domain-containing protein n=1 Tax=Erythranthe guttata TaxID=4155 RepID=A0A022QDH9_ERYGU|nr:hypothetical protein MIMGU_mgv1a021532mg [Erythranthe guttata]